MSTNSIQQIYPTPSQNVSLEGLYLREKLELEDMHPRVYTNFISSLDGRIAIEHPLTGRRGVPPAISNPHDWRLFQELAARSDILLVSARYIRELVNGNGQATLPISPDTAFSDLMEWRLENNLPPQPAIAILSASLNLPYEQLCKQLQRNVYVVTGDDADPSVITNIENNGATVLRAGKGNAVNGNRLIDSLVQEGFQNIYSIAGPGVLETLLRARVLNRIYLTQVHRLLGGKPYDTLLEGRLLQPPADFELKALYYDQNLETCGQFFSVYDSTNCGPKQKEEKCLR